MKSKFDEFYELLKIDRKKSHFAKDCTLESRNEKMLGEVLELKEVLQNNDLENLKEELGDVLWDLLC
jgi:NTP pyrophosphatase (non-canonical NTP hydrolase)